jgi:hypothetical protein
MRRLLLVHGGISMPRSRAVRQAPMLAGEQADRRYAIRVLKKVSLHKESPQ